MHEVAAPALPADDRRTALRAKLERARTLFNAQLALLSEADLSRPSANRAWTNGDLLWHITFYLVSIPKPRAQLRRGRRVVPPLPAWLLNAYDRIATRWGAPGTSLLVHGRIYVGAHLSALVALDSIHDEEWTRGAHLPYMGPIFPGEFRSVESFFRYHARHVAEHIAQLRPSGDQTLH